MWPAPLSDPDWMLVHHWNWFNLKQWFRSRRFPIQRTVRPEGIVVESPLFYENLRFLKCIDYLSIEKFVSKSCIKTFEKSVFPRTARFDISSFCSNCWDPISYWFRYKLRTIVRSDVFWESPDDEKIGLCIDNILWVEFSIHPERQAFTRLFIQDVQCSECLAVIGSIMHKVIGPDMISP